MKVLFFVALIMVSSLSTNVQSEDGMDVIKKLEKHAYGSELLATIQLQIESGDPADDLVKMLQEQEDKLEAAQSKDDKEILDLENQCVADLKKYKKEIEDTRKKIQSLSDLIASLTPIREGKQKARKLAEDKAAKITAKLKEIEINKAKKDAEWKLEAAEHDKLTAVIQQGRTILQNTFQQPDSFLQVKAEAQRAVLAQVSSHFGSLKKQHFKQKSINSIFRILTQVTSQAPVQASHEIIDKIFDIIQDLLDKVAESRAIEKRDYSHWMTEYHKTTKGLNDKLDAEKAKINQLSIDIAQLTKRIDLATKGLAEQKVRLQNLIEQHDQRETTCDEAGNKYAKDREARDDQREIISDAIGLLVSKIRLLKRYVGERTKTLKKPFP